MPMWPPTEDYQPVRQSTVAQPDQIEEPKPEVLQLGRGSYQGTPSGVPQLPQRNQALAAAKPEAGSLSSSLYTRISLPETPQENPPCKAASPAPPCPFWNSSSTTTNPSSRKRENSRGWAARSR